MIKHAKIRKLDNGKYRVLSEDGKNLGTYDSRAKAEERLRDVEYFKHKDKNDAKDSKKKKDEKRVSLDTRPGFFTSNYDYGEPGVGTGLYRGPMDRFDSVTDFLEKSRKERAKKKKDLDIYASMVITLTQLYSDKI